MASTSVRDIVKTEGNYVRHLMEATEMPSKLCRLHALPFAIRIVPTVECPFTGSDSAAPEIL